MDIFNSFKLGSDSWMKGQTSKILFHKSAAQEPGMQLDFQKFPFLEYSVDTEMDSAWLGTFIAHL